MNAAREQRLRFIDLMLAAYGTLNRATLMDFFGISTAQASLDIQAYTARAPGNLVYDLSARAYRRTFNFARVWY